MLKIGREKHKETSAGILYSITILFFILSLIAFIVSIESTLRNSNSSWNDFLESASIDSRYNSIYFNTVLLDSNGVMKETKERILPFTYGIDLNSFSLSFSLPLNQAKQRVYFDFINAYEVALDDMNSENAFDGVKADVNAAKNSFWGGSQNSMNFLLSSHCAKVKFADLNYFILSRGACSLNSFDFNSIRRIDLNLTVSRNFLEDFNKTELNGSETLLAEDFNSLNPNPFIKILFLDENCSNCILSPLQKIISLHFNPAQLNTIIFRCNGASCHSSPVTISIGLNSGTPFSISRDGNNSINASVEFDFNSSAGPLSIDDINFWVYRDSNKYWRQLK